MYPNNEIFEAQTMGWLESKNHSLTLVKIRPNCFELQLSSYWLGIKVRRKTLAFRSKDDAQRRFSHLEQKLFVKPTKQDYDKETRE